MAGLSDAQPLSEFETHEPATDGGEHPPLSAQPSLGGERPPFDVEPAVMAVLERLWAAGHGAYLVGGGVRDALLGRPVDDWDVTTDARPDGVLGLFPGSTYQNRFGTVLAHGVEITTFRRDHRYADHRRPDSVTFGDDVHEDLARRDLTINAIAWGRRGPDAPTRLVDPADGRGDLAAGLVRAVGDPARRFDEDALRLLRAVRIAARLDFRIEPVTRQAMIAHADDIAWVSEERIGSEVRRMLDAEAPSRALRLLDELRLLGPSLPELAALADLTGGKGGEAWERTLRSIDAIVEAHPNVERLALAAVLSELRPEAARSALERLRLAGREREAVVATIAAASAALEAADDAAIRRWMSTIPPARLEDVLALRHARASAPGERTHEAEIADRAHAQVASGAALRLADLALDGSELCEALGLAEGPLVGRLLDRLLADVLDDPSLNARDSLVTRAGRILESLTPDDLALGGAAMSDPASGSRTRPG